MEENKIFPNRKYAKTEVEAEEGASHGLSKGQLQDVYDNQRQELDPPQMKANCEPEYMINRHEQFVFHVRITIPNFDPQTGRDESLTQIQMFNPAIFAANEKSGAWDGRNVKILHDPTRVQHVDEQGKFAKKPQGKIRGL